MTVEQYFEKTGKIYGVSSKFDFGKWEHIGYVFTEIEKAYEWLKTEEHGFRERELMSKYKAQKLCGGNYEFNSQEILTYNYL